MFFRLVYLKNVLQLSRCSRCFSLQLEFPVMTSRWNYFLVFFYEFIIFNVGQLGFGRASDF